MSLAEKFKDVIRGKRRTLADAIGKRDTAKVAKILAAHKDAARWDITDRYGCVEKPVHAAASAGATDVLALMLQRGLCAVDETDRCGTTPLMIAAHTGNIAAVQLLLAKGADINAVDKSGYGTVYHACRSHNDAVMPLLLSKGADVNGPAGSCPPVMAASGDPGQLLLLRRLLDAGADPNRADKDGRTAFDACLNRPNLEAASLLLDYGARLDGNDGTTGANLLWSATVLKKDALVEKLLAHGADPDAPFNGKKGGLFEYLREKGDPAIMARLRNHVETAARKRDVEAIGKEMAAGSPAAIPVKPIKLKIST